MSTGGNYCMNLKQGKRKKIERHEHWEPEREWRYKRNEREYMKIKMS